MTKRAFPAVLLCCAWLFSGCSEVDSCREGETPGCLNSPPRDDADEPCLYDLVLRNELCVVRGGPQDFCTSCDGGELCVPELNECVPFCEAASPLPGSIDPPEAIFCEATRDPSMPNTNPMLSFEEVCRRRCRLQCQRREQFCTTSAGAAFDCAQNACEGPEVLAQCALDCPPTAAGANDLACLTRRCNDVRLSRCDSALCPTGYSASCQNVTCTNDCSIQGGGGAADGECDDGDPASALTALCRWGSDCTDCGPRRGAPPPSTLGSVCAFGVNCDGGTGSPSTADAWCIGLDKIPGLARCAPDCSRGQECADGFECVEALFEQDDGSNAPITERVGSRTLVSKACVPNQCVTLN